MINFRKITEDNFRDIINMKQPPEQRFVADNSYSLAQAWLYKDNNDVYPFAIYSDDEPVGFMMLDEDTEERSIGIWRFMIAVEHQGRGCGTEAVARIIALARESKKYDYIHLDYIPGNDRARHIYEKLGFEPTGEVDSGEICMRLYF